MTPNRRILLWGVAVAATLAAVASVGGNDEEIGAVAGQGRRPGGEAPAHREGKITQPMPELTLGSLKTRGLDDMTADLFASKSWYVPPPPPPPPKPVAPPPPFTVLGRQIEGNRVAVFVSAGDRNQVLRVGDVVDRVWRVDAIDSTRMTLVYLPLNENKYLVLGAAP